MRPSPKVLAYVDALLLKENELKEERITELAMGQKITPKEIRIGWDGISSQQEDEK